MTTLDDIAVADLMTAIELPRETWVERLNAFTTAHEGWIVTLGVVSDDGTAVSVARSAAEHFTHVIDGVSHRSLLASSLVKTQ